MSEKNDQKQTWIVASREVLARTQDMEAVVAFLRQNGATSRDSISIIRRAFNVKALGDAITIVRCSRTWTGFCPNFAEFNPSPAPRTRIYGAWRRKRPGVQAEKTSKPIDSDCVGEPGRRDSAAERDRALEELDELHAEDQEARASEDEYREHRRLVEGCRKIFQQTQDVEAALAYLRSDHATRGDSIWALRDALGIGAGDAKWIVHYSETWGGRRDVDEKFRDAVERVLRDYDPPPRNADDG